MGQELYVIKRVEERSCPRWVEQDRWVNGKIEETRFLMLFQDCFAFALIGLASCACNKQAVAAIIKIGLFIFFFPL